MEVHAPGRIKAIAIGSSTGGPRLVRSIIRRLPADLPVPIFIAQHLPLVFTRQFARQMAAESPLTVVHASQGQEVLPGVVYVGPGESHMRVVRPAAHGKGRLVVSPRPEAITLRPSVDELFRSLANVYGNRCAGIVMTGLGQDGTLGAKAIHDAGGLVITQQAASCTVYGMPRSCDEAGLSHVSMTPEEIHDFLHRFSPAYQPHE